MKLIAIDNRIPINGSEVDFYTSHVRETLNLIISYCAAHKKRTFEILQFSKSLTFLKKIELVALLTNELNPEKINTENEEILSFAIQINNFAEMQKGRIGFNRDEVLHHISLCQTLSLAYCNFFSQLTRPHFNY